MALSRPDMSEPARGYDKPVALGAATGAAPKMDSRAPVDASGVLPGELCLDVPLENLCDGSAARISVRRAQKLIQVTNGHHAEFTAEPCRSLVTFTLLRSLPVVFGLFSDMSATDRGRSYRAWQ